MRALAIVSILEITGCCPKEVRPVVPAPIEVTTTRTDCLDIPPPVATPIEIIGPNGGCPEAFALCLSLEGAKNVLKYLGEVQDYANAAWNKCGKEPQTKGDEDDGND